MTAQPTPPQHGDEDAFLLEFLDDPAMIEERPQSPGARYTLYTLSALLVVVAAWAAWAEVDRIVVARGKIVATAPPIVIQSLEPAVIREVLVRPGDRVEKGAILARLDDTYAVAERAELESRLSTLTAQIRRLKAELYDEPFETASGAASSADHRQMNLLHERRQAYRAKMTLYDETVSRLQTAAAGNAASQGGVQRQLETMKQIEGIHEELQKTATGSKQNLLERRSQRQGLERELTTAKNRQAELEKEIHTTLAERNLFRQDWRQKAAEELTAAERDYLELVERLRKAKRRAEMSELIAPASGIVLEVGERSEGSVIKDAEPLMTLAPANAPFEAEVEIDNRDVGFVHKGDVARLKIDAFPYQKHGLIDANVRTVSEGAFGRQPATTRDIGGEAFYKSRLSIVKWEPRAATPDARLIPGMSLTAEITVGRRSVLSYFLYPFLRSIDESLREP
jgi:hemolysin D